MIQGTAFPCINPVKAAKKKTHQNSGNVYLKHLKTNYYCSMRLSKCLFLRIFTEIQNSFVLKMLCVGLSGYKTSEADGSITECCQHITTIKRDEDPLEIGIPIIRPEAPEVGEEGVPIVSVSLMHSEKAGHF